MQTLVISAFSSDGSAQPPLLVPITAQVGSSQSVQIRYSSTPGSALQIVSGDTTAPICSLTGTGTNTQGQKYIQVSVQDSDGGLETVSVTTLVNAAADVGTYRTGITSAPASVTTADHPTTPVVITTTKFDQTQGAQLALQVADQAGNLATCDPIVATVGRQPGVPHRETFHHVARAESKIYIHNDMPGLNHLLLIVNGKQFKVTNLKDREVREVNVAGAMRRGDNTITFEALGTSGGSATVLIADK